MAKRAWYEALLLMYHLYSGYILSINYTCNFKSICPLSKVGDVKFYSPKEIKRNFEECGFEIFKFKIDGYIQINGFLGA